MSGRYRRGRRRTWNSGFRRSRSYSTMRSSMAKRSRGNLRAANNQNDTSDVVINLMKSVDVGVSGGFTYQMDGEQPVNHSKISQGTCALNIYDLLRKSDFYNSYANMYDQFRITSVKVKITPVRWSSYDQQQSAINAPETVVNQVQTSEGKYKIRYKYNPAYSALVEVEDPSNDGQTMTIRVRNADYAVPPIENQPSADSPLYLGVNPLTNQVIAAENGVYVPNPAGNYNNIDLEPTDFFTIGEVNEEHPDGRYRVYQYPEFFDDTGLASFVVSQANIPEGIQGTVSKQVFSGTAGPFVFPQAFTIVTAWDRSGLDVNQVRKVVPSWLINDQSFGYNWVAIPDGLTYNGVNNVNNQFHKEYAVINIGDDITSYSSAQTKQLIPGASFNCIRYLYPSSNQEKSVYYSTSSLHEQLVKAPFEDLPYLLESGNNMSEIGTIVNGQYVIQQASKIKSSELCNLISDPTVPFKPTFLLGVLGFNNADVLNITAENINQVTSKNFVKRITFNLEFDIGVTFRGLRKSQVV